MKKTYEIYLISDSTGETLDRIFLALQAQFSNFKYKSHLCSFTRTENQIIKILQSCKENKESIILYTIVDTQLSQFLKTKSKAENIPCFGVIGDLILKFSKLLHQKASRIPSGQHVLDADYYKRIEAIQFTMRHDDGKVTGDIEKSDIVLLGISRTSKTPTSIYLANRGYKTCNIPIINKNSIPIELIKNSKTSCIVGLTAEPSRILDVRKNRMNFMNEKKSVSYTNLERIKSELEMAKNIFKQYSWPIIDVTRKSVEETAASVIKIYDIIQSR
jgi:hypothetical protein